MTALDKGWREMFQRGEEFLADRNLLSALTCFERAQELGADPLESAGKRWLVYMLSGMFGNAWRESDYIRAFGFPDPHRFWDGKSLRKKRVVLRCLHGFGDSVQFLRYVPRLVELTASLTVEVPPRLVPLAPYLCGEAKIIHWDDQEVDDKTGWDSQVEVTELPYLFRTELAELPLLAQYLKIPKQKVTEVDCLLGSKARPRVGLVHTAGEWNASRSINPVEFSILLRSSCRFFSLDRGGFSLSHRAEPFMFDVVAIPHLTDGVDALAAVIANLDLVITVDTFAAHLAGALGRPCWILLQHAADWRWLCDREDSPWYPSVRLFRQPRQGDWTSVLRKVATELTDWTHTHAI